MSCLRWKRQCVFSVMGILALGLAGCSEYLTRHDKLALGAGDSKAHNAAVHTVDPWSRAAFAHRSPTDGVRAERAMKKYKEGESAPGAPQSFSPVQSSPGTAKSGS